MSESDEDVTVDADGVSIRKSLNDHQFETLAVVFDIRSGREHAAGVTLSEVIPEGVEVDDIGFHPEYGGEHWRAEEGEVIFSRTFEPGEQYTTVYGVRDFDDDQATLLAEPSLVVDESAVGGGDVEDIDDLVSQEDSDIVREVISGDRDTLPSLEDESAEAAEEPAAEEAIAGVGDGPTGTETASDPDEPEQVATAEADADGDGDGKAGVDEPIGGPADADDVDDETDVTEPIGEPAPTDDDMDEEPDITEPAGGTALEEEDVDEEPDAVEAVGGPALAEDEDDEVAVTEPAGGPALAGDDDLEDEESTADDEVEATEVEEPEAPDVTTEDDEPAVSTGMDDLVEEVGAQEPAEEETTIEEPAEEEEAERVEEPSDEITVPVTGGIARVLAKELRAGNVSYEDRRLLREELLPADGSTDARIQRLQTQMADLAAYADALERFLDEEGGAEAVLDDLEAKIDELAGDVRDVEGSLSGVEGTVDAVEASVGEVAGDVDAVEGDLDEVAADIDDVTGTVEGLERDVEAVEDDLHRVDALDQRLESVEDDVSAIHDELENLAAFRDRLSSVFGPGGGPGADAGSDDEEYGGY